MKKISRTSAEPYNFISLMGGKWQCDSPDDFWSFIFKNKSKHAIVPKISTKNDFKPFIIDVDMLLTQEYYMTTVEFTQNYIEPLAKILTTKMTCGIECTVSRRPHLVKHKYKREKGKTVWKDGFHIIFNGVQMSKSFALGIKKEFLTSPTVVNFIEKFKIIGATELIDEHVVPIGANCTVVSPGRKVGRPDPYLPIYVAIGSEVETFELSDPESKELSAAFLTDRVRWIYSYIFEWQNWKKHGTVPQKISLPEYAFIEETPQPPKKLETKNVKATKTVAACNLPLLLEYIPNSCTHAEWKQIVSFLLYIDYPVEQACDLLNNWKDPSVDDEENRGLFESLRNKNGTLL